MYLPEKQASCGRAMHTFCLSLRLEQFFVQESDGAVNFAF